MRTRERSGSGAGIQSPTAAMRDVFSGRAEAIEECLRTFSMVEGQVGFVFAVDGAVMGMDIVSRADAYADLHAKLIKSYVIDAEVKKTDQPAPTPPAAVLRFLEQAAQCTETSHPSTGCGVDYRFEHPEVCGSALVYEGVCIHGAFFAAPAVEDHGEMRGFRHRRRFRG